MKTRTALALALTLAAAPFLVAGAVAQDKADKADAAQGKTDAAVIAEQLPSYPLEVCPLSGNKLEKPVDVVVDGRLGRFCCNDCAGAFKKNPAKALAKIDEAVVAAQKKSYPLATCPLSGEELGDGGVDVVAGTKLVRVCCKNCAGKVKKDASVVMKAVDAAWIEAGKKSYPSELCPVSGEKLGSMGDPIDVLYGTRLVRLCCKGCTKAWKKDPKAVVAKVYPPKAK